VLTDATSITAGGYQTCATRSDTTVACWGYDYDGQLGDGTIANRTTPVAVLRRR
jgi:alpha-tubulin suppressor-like RCC1 family protein